MAGMLEYLQLFVELAQKGNVSQAATSLSITQPSTSIKLKRIEKEIGKPLFDRVGRTIRLNKDGEVFRDFAAHTLAHFNETLGTIQDAGKEQKEVLTICAGGHFGVSYLPKLIPAFKEKFPFVDFVAKTYHSDDILELIEAGEYEFGIAHVSDSIRSPKILTDFSFDVPIYFVCSPHHPLSKCEALKPRDIKDAFLIIPSPESSFHQYITAVFQKRGIHFNHQMSADSLDVIKGMVAGNQGVTMLPQHVVQQELDEGKLVHVPLKGLRLTRKLVCIHNVARPLSRTTRTFIEMTKELLSRKFPADAK